jgi:hypothetical protein
VRGRVFLRRPAVWAFLLPTLWLVLIWLLPVTGDSTLRDVLFGLGLVITLVGMPVLAALMVRLLIPGAAGLPRRDAVTAAAVVVVVMAGSYLIGTQHPRMINCEDFTVSGNFAPDNCTPTKDG